MQGGRAINTNPTLTLTLCRTDPMQGGRAIVFQPDRRIDGGGCADAVRLVADLPSRNSATANAIIGKATSLTFSSSVVSCHGPLSHSTLI